MTQFKPKRKPRRDTRKIARVVALIVVFAFIAAFFVGTLGTVQANAATMDPSTCVLDVDADGELNEVDQDIDGDGVLNAEDDDIDNDGLANFDDQDPAATNCTLDAPLPTAPKVVDDNSKLWVVIAVAGIGIAAPAAYFAAKRRRQK